MQTRPILAFEEPDAGEFPACILVVFQGTIIDSVADSVQRNAIGMLALVLVRADRPPTLPQMAPIPTMLHAPILIQVVAALVGVIVTAWVLRVAVLLTAWTWLNGVGAKQLLVRTIRTVGNKVVHQRLFEVRFAIRTSEVEDSLLQLFDNWKAAVFVTRVSAVG
jgi:hypothetical protein